MNVLWGFFNIIVGYILVRVGRVAKENTPAIIVFFIGGLVMSLMLAATFAEKLVPF